MGELEQIPNHQVKVDNWPLFFLQRLHHFYRKKSHCDLTLMFSTLDTIKSVKVHKLVLHACTDYFESLDIMTDSEHGEFLQLSNEMQSDVVIPIISFMYTGKLEFPVSLQPRLYEAAAKLRMTILTKLLDVQPKKVNSHKTGSQSFDDSSKISSLDGDALSSPAEHSQEINASGITVKKNDESVITVTPVSASDLEAPAASTTTVITTTTTTMTTTTAAANAKKMNNQVQTKLIKKNAGLQLTSCNAKPKVVVVSLPPTLPGRKLPVWKRKVSLAGSQFLADNIQNVQNTLKPPEKPKPTRFEWEEDLSDPTLLKPVEEALRVLSYEGASKINHPMVLEEDGISTCKESSFDSLKRNSDGSSLESPSYKRSKSDLQAMKEYGKQQQLRNEIICSEENEDDLMDTDDLYGQCDEDPDDVADFNLMGVNSSTPKPILKSLPKPEPPTPPLKRVRFSLEGKENNENQEESVHDFTMTTPTTTTTTAAAVASVMTTSSSVTTMTPTSGDGAAPKQKIVLPMNMSQIQSGKHHVKIVSEVLKKYPSLAKRDNIKLRVVSKNPVAIPPTVQQSVEGDANSGNKSSSSLVSYIFLTNKSSGELLPIKAEGNEKDKHFDVENKTGPWFCRVCDERNVIEFDSYYTYRRHLVEIHELKIDARICEYCGLKIGKRNHLLYHLYTKHNIDPPAHVSFPKCSECSYIALSDALLVKHKSGHDPKGLTCFTCNVVFKSYSLLQSHLCSEFHAQKINQREGKQIYRCPYCEALFGDGDQLGKHIVVLHWGKNSQVSDQKRKKPEVFEPQSGQQLQYSEEAVTANVSECAENPPSSELESFNNIASGIATSLSLVDNEQTVIYYEQRSEEEQDIGREATVVAGNECKEYVIAEHHEDEDAKQCSVSERDDVLEPVSMENEDSNSRMSTAEEINRSTCSDHDYTEAQTENHLRHIVPVHSVANQVADGTVIQQIISDQRLVFSNVDQGNVVFQAPCVGLPQRVLVTSGKVVLPHGDQNVILSQVIPQAPIILSSPILQQSAGNLIESRSGAIMFTSPTVVATSALTATTSTVQENQLRNIHAAVQQYSVSQSLEAVSENSEQQQEGKRSEEEETQDEEEEEDTKENILEKNIESRMPEDVKGIMETSNGVHVDAMEEAEMKPSEADLKSRVETSKIVDDWDEANDGQQNVESRSDGPSRPDFF